MRIASVQILFLASIAKIQADPLTKAENDNRLATCGKFVATKVLAGEKVAQTKAPWSVFIKNGGEVCTGTVVSPRHILTATHCFAGVVGKKWGKIHGGTYDAANCKNDHYSLKDQAILNGISFESNGKEIAKIPEKITFINACTDVVFTSAVNVVQLLVKDYAIVELYEDLTFSPSLHPVCLSENKDDNKDGVTLDYYGFGVDPPTATATPLGEAGTLRHETIKTLKHHQTSEHNFVARDPTGKNVACPGDSGGGAIANVNDASKKKTIVGVLSQTSCAGHRLTNTFEMYNSVGHFYKITCEITGICKKDDYDGKHAGYVRPNKPPRTTPQTPTVQSQNQNPRNGSPNNQNQNGRPNLNSQTETATEKSNEDPNVIEIDLGPDMAHRSFSIIFTACVLMYFVW